MKIQELLKEKENNKDLIVIDVRQPEELVGPLGKLEDVINIPLPELNTNIIKLEQYKNHKLAIICQSGSRSSVATSILKQHGFNAHNIEGGMTAYYYLNR